MKPHVVTIEIDQRGQGKVSLDGLELTTSRVEFVSDAHRPTEVRLTVYATVQARLELTPEQLAGEAETGNVKWDVKPIGAAPDDGVTRAALKMNEAADRMVTATGSFQDRVNRLVREGITVEVGK